MRAPLPLHDRRPCIALGLGAAALLLATAASAQQPGPAPGPAEVAPAPPPAAAPAPAPQQVAEPARADDPWGVEGRTSAAAHPSGTAFGPTLHLRYDGLVLDLPCSARDDTAACASAALGIVDHLRRGCPGGDDDGDVRDDDHGRGDRSDDGPGRGDQGDRGRDDRDGHSPDRSGRGDQGRDRGDRGDDGSDNGR